MQERHFPGFSTTFTKRLPLPNMPRMSEMKRMQVEAVVLGGGSAGYAAARTLHAGGKRVAVIDGGRELGGLCILRGCMPTKALLWAAEVRHLTRHAGIWGIQPGEISHDWRKVLARKDAMIQDFAGYRREQLQDGRFQLLRQHARFISPQVLQLSDGSEVEAEHFVIATGSRVSSPPLRDLAEAGYWTSDDALRAEKLPRSMIILGGGAIAVEFAQVLARFDVQVTLIQRSARLIKEFEPAASECLERTFRSEGIEVITGTELVSAGRDKQGKWVQYRKDDELKTVHAEEILFALGRSPANEGLGLEQAGVQLDSRGRIITDPTQKTTAAHIYAAGDCTGPHEIVHIAIQQGETAAAHILHPNQMEPKMDYRLLSSIVFTDPQIAQVGLTEEAARKAKIPVLAADYPFNDHGKSMIMNAMEGFVKLVAHAKTGEIIGGTCAGPVGGELIHEIIVAMRARMTVADLASTPHYHPTLAEIWTYPAEELADQIQG